MAISVGDKIPDANLLRVGAEGPEAVALSTFVGTGKTVLFGLPGAYTRTCTAAHMPSFVRTADAFRNKGISHIICVTVNDPFVVDAWAKDTGAKEAGIEVLADADGALTKAMGLDFTAPPVGFYGRSKRYAMLLEDGVVTVLDAEESPGECGISSGEDLLKKA